VLDLVDARSAAAPGSGMVGSVVGGCLGHPWGHESDGSEGQGEGADQEHGQGISHKVDQ
jgi:hypothetical protein